MRHIFLKLGAIGAFSAVALGAFGAHALKNRLSSDLLAIFHTGVTYQMWHALGLILIALLSQTTSTSKWLNLSGWLMAGGIVVFSGSLYILALSGQRSWGMVTPLGGVAFLAAWFCLYLHTQK